VIEARIECITYRYHIDDLGLHLRKGDIEYLDEGKARNSQDLLLAVRAGAVSVRYVERCQVAKRPDPPKRTPVAVQMSRPNRGGLGGPGVNQSPQHPGPRTKEETDEVEAKAVAAAKQAVQEGMAELKELLVAAQGGGQATIPQDQLEAALRNVLPTGGVAIAPAKKSDEDKIHFFPEGIVDKDAKADITVESSSSDADDLDAAAAAFAATKKTKKKTRKKKTAKDSEEPKE